VSWECTNTSPKHYFGVSMGLVGWLVFTLSHHRCTDQHYQVRRHWWCGLGMV